MEKIIIESPKYGTFEVLVDEENFEELSKFNWYVRKNKHVFYVLCNIIVNENKKTLQMHRKVMGLNFGDKLIVDHKDHNGLNNRKENLRIVTHGQNMQNKRSSKNSSSKYLGVHLFKLTNKWRAEIKVNKKKFSLGFFADENEAAIAYNNAAITHFGEFANLNQIG